MPESQPQMRGPFRTETTAEDERVVVALHGELDIATAPSVEEDVAAARADRPEADVVLDLRGITFIDSSGLRALLRLRELGEADGFAFAIVDGDGPVRRLLALTNLAGRFEYAAG